MPTRDRHGRVLALRDDLRKYVQGTMTDLCGGATSLRAEGTYRNRKSELVRESITVVESYVPRVVGTELRRAFQRLIEEIAKRADQEALAVVVDGLFLVHHPESTPTTKAKT